MKRTGVISFQGDFQKHLKRSAELGMSPVEVRDPTDLKTLDALIIPGGESTTIGMLLQRFGLLEPIRKLVTAGLPVLGTCAGAILLSDQINGSEQPRIGGLHTDVMRNAYGRQVESFEAGLNVVDASWERWKESDVLGVFIRAPVILTAGDDVSTILAFENHPVMVRQENIVAVTFHPELTSDSRVHEYFFEEVVGT